MQQALEQVGPSLVVHPDAAKAEQPGECARHHPPVPSSRSLESIPRRAIRGAMPFARSARRRSEASLSNSRRSPAADAFR